MNLNYPEVAINARAEGRVFVLAFVDTLGRVVRAEILKGVGAGLDEEALRVVWVTTFTPGKQRKKK